MNKEDIMLALRLTAMGRYGHPLQEQLADALVEVFIRQLPALPDGSVNPAATPLADKAARAKKAA